MPLAAPELGVLPLGIRVATFLTACARGVRRSLPWMAVAFALPLAAAFAFQMTREPVYRTSASVFVDPQISRPGGGPGAADPGVLAAQIRLASSRTVLQNAIAKEKLVEDVTFMARPSGAMALVKMAMAAAGLGAAAPSEDRPAAILRLVSGSIQARPGDGSNLIDIVASSQSPENAMRLANAVAQALVDEIVASADAALGSERSRATRRAEELKARLNEAEAKLAKYRAQNGLDAAQPRATGADGDPAGQLAKIRQATADARSKYEQVQRALASGKEPEVVADLIRTPSLERLKAQYTEASAQEISFRSSLGPRHPAYLEVQQQVREKKRLLQEGLRLSLTSARVEWQSLREQEMALEKRAGGVQAPAPQPAQPPMQLREFEREVEIARAAYDRYVRSLDAPEPGAPGVVARVVAAAAQPLTASIEGRGAIWSAALTISVLLAALTGVLGMMRAFRPAKSNLSPNAGAVRTKRAAEPSPATEPAAAAKVTPGATAPPAKVVRVAQRPAPAAAAATTLESVATDLAHRLDEFPLQTLLITASGAGKSEAAMALARAAQSHEMRVLLIDADESGAALTSRHGNGPVVGTVLIQGRARPLVAVPGPGRHRIALIPVESRLHAVPAQAALSLKGIAGNFDLVIIDGPALSGSLIERKLARAAQGVLLIHDGDEPPRLEPILRDLGVSPEQLRVVTPARAAAATAPAATETPARMKPVVRLRKVA